MLNRRYLRVKVMQALYAFFATGSNDPDDINRGEKELMRSIDKIYNLYLYMLLLLCEVSEAAQAALDLRKEKRLPTEEDLNPNVRFAQNGVVREILANRNFRKQIDMRKISWAQEKERDLVKQVLRLVQESDEYTEFMKKRSGSFEDDKKFWQKIHRSYIADFDLLHAHLEEESVYWYDDIVLVNITVGKTLQYLRKGSPDDPRMLIRLFKDKEEDVEFVKQLFRKTIDNNTRYQEIISAKTRNWEVDRIAVMDVMLMKMALCELEKFASIPVKVSLNEYIELSKNYSTPKSKVFINGVLDKLVGDMRADGMIKKSGRGLME